MIGIQIGIRISRLTAITTRTFALSSFPYTRPRIEDDDDVKKLFSSYRRSLCRRSAFGRLDAVSDSTVLRRSSNSSFTRVSSERPKQEYKAHAALRMKDKVPEGFELIAASDLVFQGVFPLMNTLSYITALVGYPLSITKIYSAYQDLHYSQSIFDVPFYSQSTTFACIFVVAYGVLFIAFRFCLDAFMLRLYLNRSSSTYCLITQGNFFRRRNFFTPSEIRLNPDRFWCDFEVGGSATLLDADDFRNKADYNAIAASAAENERKCTSKR